MKNKILHTLSHKQVQPYPWNGCDSCHDAFGTTIKVLLFSLICGVFYKITVLNMSEIFSWCQEKKVSALFSWSFCNKETEI